MRFTRVRIKNFRILEDLDVDLNQSLVFLNGNNGHGKTSFQSAVSWCLYGENQLPQLDDINVGLVSQRQVEENPGKGIFPLSVEIDIDFVEQEQKVNLKREVQWNVEKERAVPGSEKFVVRVSSTDKSSSTQVIDPGDAWVDKWLPIRFKNFFLFDGEQMSEFFDSATRLAVKDAVNEIAQVDLFLELKRRYADLAAGYETARSKLGSSGAQNAHSKWQSQLKLLELVREELVSELDAVRQKETELNNVVKALKNVEGAKVIIENIRRAEGERASKKNERASAQRRYEDALLEKGQFIQLTEVFEGVGKTVDRAKAEGWYPIPFDIKAMEDLLSDGKCICGVNLQEDKRAHNHLTEEIKKRRQAGDLGKILQDIFGQVQITTAKFSIESEGVEAASAALDNAERNVDLVEENLRGLRLQVKELLAGNTIEEAEELANREEKLSRELDTHRDQVIHLRDNEIPRIEKTAEKAEKEYNKLTKKDVESETLNLKREIAESLSKSSEQVYEQAVERVRKALENSISEKFNKIIRGDEFVTKIDDNFAVQTLAQDGKTAALSSGQNMLKGYVLTIAMREVVGLYFPLLVDTPLGRLSEEFRDELGELLTEFVAAIDDSMDSQIVFLMHDGEYTPYTQDRFVGLKPKELYFQWAVPKKQSVVGEGINPEWFKYSAWKDRKAGKI